jgi:hypothetical protein
VRCPPPEIEPIPGLRLPAYAAEGAGGVAAGMVAERGYASMVGLAVASERLHQRLRLDRALSYGVGGAYGVLNAREAHLTLIADALEEHVDVVAGQFVDTIAQLASDGPTDDEMIEQRAQYGRAPDQGARVTAMLDGRARDELLGAQPFTEAELDAEMAALESSDVAAALGAAYETAIVAVPEGSARPHPSFSPWGTGAHAPVEGRRFRVRGLSGAARKRDFRISETAVSMKMPDGETVTIAFDDCVAAIAEPDGKITLHSVDGSYIAIVPSALRDGAEAEAALRAGLPGWKFVPAAAT